MADPVLQQSAVWFGGYDFSGELNKADIKASRAELANSRLTDDIAGSFPGIEQIDAAIEGFFSSGAGSVDAVTAARLIGATPDYSEWPLTFAPPLAPTAAAGADGNIAYNLRTAQVGVKFGAEHGQLLPFYMSSVERTGRLDRCTIMVPKATRTATYTGTAQQLGAIVASTNKLVCVLHVFSVTGASGSVTVTVESDTVGFPSAVVRGTFTAVATAAGVGRQVLEITSATSDDYWRFVATWTAGTNFSLAGLAALVAV